MLSCHGAAGPETTASSPSPTSIPPPPRSSSGTRCSRFLLREELITHERVELLSSWRHSGFSVHNSVYLPPSDQQAIEALVRYMTRPPVSLARLRLLPGKDQVLHFPKTGGDDPGSTRPEQVDAMDYVARVLAQIPPPRKHLVRYHG